MNTYGPVHLLNIEYFFRLIYDAFFKVTGGSAAPYVIFLGELWNFVTFFAYAFSLVCIGVLVYSTMRLHQIKEEEEHKYETIEPEEAESETEHSRWKHVMTLIESANESDWRQAIIEADIMLEDILSTHGYAGDGVGEKLKQGDPARFMTLNDAWEAHKVRNEIAHQGSEYRLSDQMAYRTIAKYKNVFEEFHAI